MFLKVTFLKIIFSFWNSLYCCQILTSQNSQLIRFNSFIGTSHHPDLDSFNEAGSASFGVILLVSAVTSISLSIIITLIVWRIRRLQKSKTASPRRDRTNKCQGDQSNGYVSDARPSRFYSSNVLVSTTQHERDDDPYLALGRESSVSCKDDYSEYDEIKWVTAP